MRTTGNSTITDNGDEKKEIRNKHNEKKEEDRLQENTVQDTYKKYIS